MLAGKINKKYDDFFSIEKKNQNLIEIHMRIYHEYIMKSWNNTPLIF